MPRQYPGVTDEEYKQYLVRYNEAVAVIEKIKHLTKLAFNEEVNVIWVPDIKVLVDAGYEFTKVGCYYKLNGTTVIFGEREL